MRLRDSLTSATGSLRTNVTRSILTILGIVIGITAIILVMALGRGAQELVLNQIRAFGPDTIVVESGREPRGPSDFAEAFSNSLKVRDVAALTNPANVPDAAEVAPILVAVTAVQYGNETKRANIRGTSPTAFNVLHLKQESGVFFTEADVDQRASVAVIGSEIREELFGESEALGARVRISGRAFRVVGVLAPYGQSSFLPVDEVVLIPHTTMREYMLRQDHYNAIMVRAADASLADRVKRDIERTLREQHGITDPEKDDFHVHTQQDAIERIGVIATALTALLAALAAISLVVGGVGIMNIMLVAVAERTREIGLRKALGARDADIRRQFLLESVVLTVAGGVVGVVLGAMLAFLTAFVLQRTVASGWSFTFPVSAALLGIGVAAAIGLIFGLYPAQKAARKSPIEALRYE